MLTDASTDRKPRLADLCYGGFMLILQLRAVSEFGDPERLRRRILEFINRLERRAKEAGYPSEDIRYTKFALVAFLDETILASQWSQKDLWMSNPLQLELFGRMDAGEMFFRNLEELRRHSAGNVEVLEVYYLCLALGFKGRYSLFEQDKLWFILEDLYGELQRLRGDKSTRLSPSGERREQITEVVKKEVPAWIVAVGAGAIGFIFYIIMLLLSQNAASEAIGKL
ncbi:MAG: DotU family type IV/VI secretion system protein [Calditrichaeota bacterium]|nr:MAG: DotU family type IV/VI secretion system protein [Calditrichota bacterium]